MKSHDEAVIAMLREDPAMALDYLRAAFDELDEPGGESAFLMALRHVVDAQGGVAAIAQRAEVSRESLYRALAQGKPDAAYDVRRHQGHGHSLPRLDSPNARSNSGLMICCKMAAAWRPVALTMTRPNSG